MKTKLKYSVHISLQQTHSAHVNNVKSESRNSFIPRTFEKPVGFDEIDDTSCLNSFIGTFAKSSFTKILK